MAEETSTSSETTTETSAPPESPIFTETKQGTLPLFPRSEETPPLQEASASIEEKETEEEKKKKTEGAKEGVPSHG
jgi:hypothetical protein